MLLLLHRKLRKLFFSLLLLRLFLFAFVNPRLTATIVISGTNNRVGERSSSGSIGSISIAGQNLQMILKNVSNGGMLCNRALEPYMQFFLELRVSCLSSK